MSAASGVAVHADGKGSSAAYLSHLEKRLSEITLTERLGSVPDGEVNPAVGIGSLMQQLAEFGQAALARKHGAGRDGEDVRAVELPPTEWLLSPGGVSVGTAVRRTLSDYDPRFDPVRTRGPGWLVLGGCRNIYCGTGSADGLFHGEDGSTSRLFA